MPTHDGYEWPDDETAVQAQSEIAVYAGGNGHVVIRSRDALLDEQVICILPQHVESVIRALREAKKRA